MSDSTESQYNRLDQRLTQLEEQLNQLHSKQEKLLHYIIHGPDSSTKKTNDSASTLTPKPPLQPPPSSPSPSRSQADRPHFNEVINTAHILPLIAVICFVLAAVFLVKLGIDSGWLTPIRQWGILCLLGFALTGAGRLFDQIEKNYRAYLSASGCVVLYIASFASSLYFQILSPEISFSMAGLVSLLSLQLFDYHRSEVFSVVTSIGTYLSPLLMGTQIDLLLHGAYFVLWAAIFSTFSVDLKSRSLVLTSSYFGIGVFTLLFSRSTESHELIAIILVLIAQFAIFAYGVYSYSIRNQARLTAEESLYYLPALLFFYGTTYFFLNKLTPDFAPWISLLFCGFLGSLYFFAQKKLQNLQSEALVQGFFAVVLFHSGYLQILPEQSKPWLVPTFLLLNYISERKKDFPQLSKYLKAAFFLMGLLEFASLTFKLVSESNLESLPASLATLLIGIFVYFKQARLNQNHNRIFLSLVHCLAILILYRLFYDFGTFAVSLGWGLYSTLILAAASWKKDRDLAESSLLVLVITSLKALLYDASHAASGLRILSLLLTGAVMYGAGYYFRKIRAWKKSDV